MLNSTPTSTLPRRRGGQPANRNALKHGLHARKHSTSFSSIPHADTALQPALYMNAEVFSQVVLALQLPFAMFPLLHFTSSQKRMGKWKLGWFLLVAGWGSAILITVMDVYSLPESLREECTRS